MKKYFYLCILGLLSTHTYAQVGVSTTSPQSTLDVNGKTTLRKELRVGGTSTQIGKAGLNGQVLVSQGEGLSAAWKYLKVSFMEEGQYKLINSYLSSDQVGITTLSNNTSGDNIFINSVGDDITDTSKGRWVKIDGLKNEFVVKTDKNRLTYQFQTGVEMKAPLAGTSQNIGFICGVFRNNKLVAVRPDRIASNNSGRNGIQDYIFTLNYTEQDVPMGMQNVEVACRKTDTSISENKFVIGRNIDDTNKVSNAFTLESMIKIDVIEYVTYITN